VNITFVPALMRRAKTPFL